MIDPDLKYEHHHDNSVYIGDAIRSMFELVVWIIKDKISKFSRIPPAKSWHILRFMVNSLDAFKDVQGWFVEGTIATQCSLGAFYSCYPCVPTRIAVCTFPRSIILDKTCS